MTEQTDSGRKLADRFGIHLLLDNSVQIAGVRFAGGTLWTDFQTVGRSDTRSKMAEAAGREGMSD
ncbi:hypothetical protein [Devosia sp. 919]|uniref:hypothetical protein n=1 Tax=Devosia sp. 919 TaxID=2726065 RepID=UPI00155650D0|nr:hypothetical protein [Devosia sp. 919]